jgi:hypothetical protein
MQVKERMEEMRLALKAQADCNAKTKDEVFFVPETKGEKKKMYIIWQVLPTEADMTAKSKEACSPNNREKKKIEAGGKKKITGHAKYEGECIQSNLIII